MGFLTLQIELPAYSHSFTLQVPVTSNILDVKREISRTCVGKPNTNGQRIIWRGRALTDNEKVSELWKSPVEPLVIHLAVHPSAWSSAPPEIPRASLPPLPSPTLPQPTRYYNPARHPIHQTSIESLINHPLVYVLFWHRNALIALKGRRVVQPNPNDMVSARTLAIQTVERLGYQWPSILDQEFPPYTEGGLIYDTLTTPSGQTYLSLHNPGAIPTPLQVHALKVLTYTFPLLALPIHPQTVARVVPPQQVHIPPNINQLLQQLGLPQLRVVHPNNGRGIWGHVWQLPLRPLIGPLLMLIFRTLLLLYFVAPSRKPFFAAVLLAWVFYECWQAVRNGILRGLRAGVGDGAARRDNQAVPIPPQHGVVPPANQQGGDGRAVNGPQNQNGNLFDSLSLINIQQEDRTLSAPAELVMPEPGRMHKLSSFLSLFLVTLEPSAWNRRRAMLRQREGRLKTEANVRTAPLREVGEGEGSSDNKVFNERRAALVTEYERKPRWIKEYIERAVQGDWVDDAD